jgi:hypothetical protein
LDSRWNFKYGKISFAGAGTQTAALGFGGYTTAVTAATEEYDGTSWTTSPGSLNTARRFIISRFQTAALAFGGSDPAKQEQQKNMMEHLGHQISCKYVNSKR